MVRTAVLFVASIGLVGCDSYVERSEHQARAELARYTGWRHAQATARDDVMREVGIIRSGRLAEGEEVTIPLDVTGAQQANVIAACDKRCLDIDLRVVTEDGRLIGVDEEEDNAPSVYIQEAKPNKLLLKIRMLRCEAPSCAYAINQLQYDDYTGGFGTCFAVSPNGLLMTSFHVVDGASTINVRFPDGRKGEAEVFRGSADNDLALLQTKIPTPDWLSFTPTAEIPIGTPAFTVGYPSPQLLGSELKLTEGSVSSLAGMEESTMLQISIPIQGGNSGGPVIDHSGLVLGIVEGFVHEDDDGTPMQLTNFARHARIATLLLPPETRSSRQPTTANRQQAIARATKAVCQITTE